MSARQREYEDGQLVPGTRYRVISLIGLGGMGSVYEVEHEALGKRFVLKALLRELVGREELVRRVKNEQRALGQLRHPNVVQVTDGGVDVHGIPFFVMEKLEGETLSQRLRREGRLPVADALHIMAQVAAGLAAAHDLSIVHRDVKPPNIFLEQRGGVRILDFGIAKMHALDDKLTAHGVAIGTPRYMSPEQARGDRVDGRADLYACGLLLFELIAGRGPFDDVKNLSDILFAHLVRPAPRLSLRVPEVSAELDAWVAALLAKEPAERPDSAHRLAESLARLAAEQRERDASGGLTPYAEHELPTRYDEQRCSPLAHYAAAPTTEIVSALHVEELEAQPSLGFTEERTERDGPASRSRSAGSSSASVAVVTSDVGGFTSGRSASLSTRTVPLGLEAWVEAPEPSGAGGEAAAAAVAEPETRTALPGAVVAPTTPFSVVTARRRESGRERLPPRWTLGLLGGLALGVMGLALGGGWWLGRSQTPPGLPPAAILADPVVAVSPPGPSPEAAPLGSSVALAETLVAAPASAGSAPARRVDVPLAAPGQAGSVPASPSPALSRRVVSLPAPGTHGGPTTRKPAKPAPRRSVAGLPGSGL